LYQSQRVNIFSLKCDSPLPLRPWPYTTEIKESFVTDKGKGPKTRVPCKAPTLSWGSDKIYVFKPADKAVYQAT